MKQFDCQTKQNVKKVTGKKQSAHIKFGTFFFFFYLSAGQSDLCFNKRRNRRKHATLLSLSLLVLSREGKADMEGRYNTRLHHVTLTKFNFLLLLLCIFFNYN